MTIDRATLHETAALTMRRPDGHLTKREALDLAREYGATVWESRARVDKRYAGEPLSAAPYETIESGPNLLLTAGATLAWNLLTGGGGTVFDAANAHLAVGNSTTPPDAAHTDLQGASKFRKVVDAAPTINAAQCQFVATFATSEANFDWQEAGVANSAAGAVLLDRFLQAFGIKSSSLQWTLTINLAWA